MTTNQNLIQLSHQHLSHLRAQTSEVQKRIQKLNAKQEARDKTKQSIISKQREEVEKRWQEHLIKIQEAKKRNEELVLKIVDAVPTTSVQSSKVQLEIAKQQFMNHMVESLHDIEIEEKRRKLVVLQEIEDKIKKAEELKQKARDEWREEMILKQALANKEAELKLAEEQARKESIERQIIRKRFEEEQEEKRKLLETHAELVAEQFHTKEERRISDAAADSVELWKQELHKIYEKPAEIHKTPFEAHAEPHKLPIEEAFPEFSTSNTKRQPQHPSRIHPAQQRNQSITSQPIPKQKLQEKKLQTPNVPELPIQRIPNIIDSFSDSSVSLTEDEKSIHKQSSEESAYYQDGYSTMNESIEEVTTFSQYKKQIQTQKQNKELQGKQYLNNSNKQLINREPLQSEKKLPPIDNNNKIPKIQENVFKFEESFVEEPKNIKPSSKPIVDIASDASFEESETRPRIDPSPTQEDQNNFKFNPNDYEISQKNQQKLNPIKTNEILHKNEIHETFYTPNFEITEKPLKIPNENVPSDRIIPTHQLSENSDIEDEKLTPQYQETKLNPISNKPTLAITTGKLENESIQSNITTPTSEIQGRESLTSNEGPFIENTHSTQTNETDDKKVNSSDQPEGRKSFFSRLTKNRTRRQSRKSEPAVTPIEEEKEEEIEYYTTETGSEAPQSVLERKACSEVRRFLRTTFPVKIVMGMQELTASIESDMSEQYTKGSLSSRLRGRNSTKYPFPYEKRFANRKSPLMDYDGPSRVSLIEAAIDSDEEILSKYPYHVKSELLLDIIKYTPNTFLTKQLYEKLHDPDILIEEWTPEFMEQKAQIRGPTLEMWKLIISHVKFLCKTDSSKKSHVIASFASVLTPRSSEKLGTGFIQDRDETVERMKKLIEYSSEGKKKARLSLGSTSSTKRKSDNEGSTGRKSSPASIPSSLPKVTKESNDKSVNKPRATQVGGGIILGGGRKGPITGGSAFSSGNILDRLKSGKTLDSDDEDEDDFNITVFQDTSKKTFGFGNINFNSKGNDEFGDYGEFDL